MEQKYQSPTALSVNFVPTDVLLVSELMEQADVHGAVVTFPEGQF